MMRDLFLGVGLRFDTEQARRVSEDLLLKVSVIVAVINHGYILAHPEEPLLYDANVAYTEPDQLARPRVPKEKMRSVIDALRAAGADDLDTIVPIVRFLKGMEVFLDVPALYRRGKGDCNELAPVRVAEYWRAGILARPRLVPHDNDRGGITYHMDVSLPDGETEDPSLVLGMGGAGRAADRLAEIGKLGARWGALVAAAPSVAHATGNSIGTVARQIDMMGLIPRDGVFRVGGAPVRVLPRQAIGGARPMMRRAA